MRLRRFLISDPMARRTLLDFEIDAKSEGIAVTEWELDHVQVAMPAHSEEACDAFYVDLLGFVIEEKPAPLRARGGRWYRRGPVVVHLGVDPDFRPALKAHLALRVDHYDELLGRLEGAGYEVRHDRELEGVTRCYVADPNGNRLELIDLTSSR